MHAWTCTLRTVQQRHISTQAWMPPRKCRTHAKQCLDTSIVHIGTRTLGPKLTNFKNVLSKPVIALSLRLVLWGQRSYGMDLTKHTGVRVLVPAGAHGAPLSSRTTTSTPWGHCPRVDICILCSRCEDCQDLHRWQRRLEGCVHAVHLCPALPGKTMYKGRFPV